MGFMIALAQCRRPEDGDVVSDVRRWAREAREAGASLLVFPEALMTKFDGSVERFAQLAEPADGPFARAVDAIAAQEGLWIAYTMNERNDTPGAATAESATAPGASALSNSVVSEPSTSERATALPFNTAVITDARGVQRARYRKVHLFDAQGFRESDRMAAGDELMAPVEAPFARIGLGICYDLRFPEVALAAALAGAQIMLYPAAWVSGPLKVEQWETLLRARAIENGLFVAGACCVNEGRIGHSCVFGPDGALLAASDGAEQLVTCNIDLNEVDRVRAATPSLKHRRPDCYVFAS